MTHVLSPSEFDSYYGSYIRKIEAVSVSEALSYDMDLWESFFKNITEKNDLSPYAFGKWSVKQVLQHCMDTERIFSTRALMFARGETQNIAGYDHDLYALNSRADASSLLRLKSEFVALRNSTRVLFESFSNVEMQKVGTANDKKVSVRALAYIIPGHCIHHFNVLRNKYDLAF